MFIHESVRKCTVEGPLLSQGGHGFAVYIYTGVFFMISFALLTSNFGSYVYFVPFDLGYIGGTFGYLCTLFLVYWYTPPPIPHKPVGPCSLSEQAFR